VLLNVFESGLEVYLLLSSVAKVKNTIGLTFGYVNTAVVGVNQTPVVCDSVLGGNVWGVTHDEESFMPLTQDEATDQ